MKLLNIYVQDLIRVPLLHLFNVNVKYLANNKVGYLGDIWNVYFLVEFFPPL